jgi:hypothetical protein
MGDLWDFIRDRWEWDSFWREQIILAVILGAIGLAFVIAETAVKRRAHGG